MMGRNVGMTRRIVALFNTSMRMKVKEDTEKSRNYSHPPLFHRAQSAESIRV